MSVYDVHMRVVPPAGTFTHRPYPVGTNVRKANPMTSPPPTTPFRHRTLPLAATTTILAAALFYFGTGYHPIAALTWLAPLPVLLLAPRVSAISAGSTAFLAYFLGTANNWAFSAHSHDLPLPASMAINVGCGLFFAAAVALFAALARRGHGVAAAIATPAVWTSAMYLVALLNPMGLIEPFATPQADQPLLIQAASLTGIWGVTFLVLFIPAGIAATTAPAVSTPARWRTAGCTIAIAVIALVGGAVRLAESDDAPRQLALIAHNHSGWGVDVGTPQGRDLVDEYVAEISALPSQINLAVLPEGAFSADENSLAALVDPMTRLAQERGINIVVGMVYHPHGGIEQNAITFLADGGDPVIYRKHYDRSGQIPGDDLVFPLAQDPGVGVEICGDLTHVDVSREYGTAGARFMAIPASTEGDNGWQLARTGLFRGLENGFAVAWSGRDGELMVSDCFG
ncbi:MAG: nitrilase-related carbon-nitrogen hydrolase, partial [Stackebrandtia sp.]